MKRLPALVARRTVSSWAASLLVFWLLTPWAASQMPDPPGQVAPGVRPEQEAYLFAHMMAGDYWRLYYSISRDGLHWSLLNAGRRVFEEYRGHADICQGHDGRYYLIGNRSDGAPDINFWVSDDLIRWDKYSDYTPDLKRVPDYPKALDRIGAPKVFYDEATRQYLVTWHTPHDLGETDLPEPYWASQRTLYALSKDLKTFASPPRKLFDGDWDMATIDTIVRRVDGRYYAILKDERYPTLDWPTGKSIRIGSAPNLTGPYTKPAPPITPNFREAPTLIPSPNGQAWYLYYEQYPGVSYGLSVAENLNGPWMQVAGNQRPDWDKYHLPPGVRHGAMIPIRRAQYDALVAAFPFQADGVSTAPLLGRIRPRSAQEITSSSWSIGGETLDRDYAVYENYRDHLGPLGAKGIRLQAGWAKCEKAPGVYDWDWLDRIVDDALAQGVQPWLETSYGNPIYPGGGDIGLGGGIPTSPEALAAWDKWVRALARRYDDRVKEWEIWNEPDLGSKVPAADYARLYIRTAEIIRDEAPGAKIRALSLAGNTAYAEAFLKYIRAQKKTNLIDAVTVHGYPRNPDDTSSLDRMRALLDEYDLKIPVIQGETGAPSQLQKHYALRDIPWTETTQAKWNLRRMLAHHGQGAPFSLFCISDMRYRINGEIRMNYKGLLKTNPDQTISHRKMAYDAAQRVFSIFDDSWERLPGVDCDAETTRSLAAYTWKHRRTGALMTAAWFKDAPPIESRAATPTNLRFRNGQFKEPVWVDLLSGKVYGPLKSENGRTLPQVLLYDSPVLIGDMEGLKEFIAPARRP